MIEADLHEMEKYLSEKEKAVKAVMCRD